MPTTIKDLGIGKLRQQMQQLGRVKIMIGVQGEEARAKHPNADESVGKIAFWLHYGTKRMPARPYIDRAIAMLTKRAYPVVKKAMSDLIDGRAATVAEAMTPLGEMAVEQVMHEIETSREWAAPLAQTTIDRKGHDQPLVDTRTVAKATSYTIRDRESIIASGKGPGGG